MQEDFSNPFDIFESLFQGMGGMGGSRAARNRPVQGDDESYRLVLNFKEAVFGVEKEIEITRFESCTTCDGSGAKPGTEPTKCRTCGGQGQVLASARTPLGIFQQVMTCSTCNGTGEYFTPCRTCRGDGCVLRSKKISFKVPAGVDSGNRLRVRSEGNAGKRGGGPGDLYVFMEVLSDPVLKRDGTNILHTCNVSYIDAILGTTINVPTVDGVVDLKICNAPIPRIRRRHCDVYTQVRKCPHVYTLSIKYNKDQSTTKRGIHSYANLKVQIQSYTGYDNYYTLQVSFITTKSKSTIYK